VTQQPNTPLPWINYLGSGMDLKIYIDKNLIEGNMIKSIPEGLSEVMVSVLSGN